MTLLDAGLAVAGEKAEVVEGKLLDPNVSDAWDLEGMGKAMADTARDVHAFKQEKVHTVSLLVQDKAVRKRLLTTPMPVGAASAQDVVRWVWLGE